IRSDLVTGVQTCALPIFWARAVCASASVASRLAFQEAAKLDATLAEAHTALAQIAFYYPPQDFDAAAVEGVNATRVDPDNFGAQDRKSVGWGRGVARRVE